MAKGRHVQYLAACAVCLAAVAAGACLMWSTPVIPKFHNNETNMEITDAQISWMASMSSPGYVSGSLITKYTSDRFGRRATILGSALPMIIGSILVLTTNIAWCLYITRILWGFGTGMIVTVSAVYLAEVSDKEIRGTLTSAFRFMQSFGNFLVMTVGPLVSYKHLNYMLLILPINFFVACCFIPETPYFYLKEKKVAAAKASLLKLSENKDEKIIDERLLAMKSDVSKEMLHSRSANELFAGKRYRKAVTIISVLKLTQIMSGLIAIQQYLGPIVQESKTNLDVSTVLLIFGALKFTVGILSSVIVDRIGRRPLLCYSYLSSGITLTIVGAYFWINPSSPIYSPIPFIAIILSMMSAIVGFDTLGFVIAGEIFPINVKSVALTYQNILGGLLNFVVVKSYQRMKNMIGLTGVFLFYAIFSFVGLVFSYFVVLETKSKSFREIQMELQGDLYDDTDNSSNKEVSYMNQIDQRTDVYVSLTLR